jgi:hypothetical protein
MDDSIPIPSQKDLDKYRDPALRAGLKAAPEDPNFSARYVNYQHWLAAQEMKGADHMAKAQVQRVISAHELYPSDNLARLQHGHFQTVRT